MGIVCEVCDAAATLAQDIDDLEAAAVDERVDGKHCFRWWGGRRKRRYGGRKREVVLVQSCLSCFG